MAHTVMEYCGFQFSVPNTDDGHWRYAIHPKRDRRHSKFGPAAACPRDGYNSKAAAIAAGKNAIDLWLGRDGVIERESASVTAC